MKVQSKPSICTKISYTLAKDYINELYDGAVPS
jgi:hypothetical protein